MSRRMLTLVEEQTEERFVKDVLAPHLVSRDLLFEKPTVLMTKRVMAATARHTDRERFQEALQRRHACGDLLRECDATPKNMS